MREIEEIRQQLNLTQSEFAQLIGITRMSYLNKISGDSSFKVGELIKISELCNEDVVVKNGADMYSFKITKL